MADRRDKQVVQRVFETSLSGLREDPYLAQRVINIAHGKGDIVMKKKLSIGFVISLALIVVMLCSVAIAAVSKLDNNAATMNAVENDIVFEVVEHVAYIKAYRGNDTQIIIPSQITYEGQSVSVTEIHPNAFSGCTSVQTVVIPVSVTSIFNRAFSDCKNLTKIVFQGNTPPAIVSNWLDGTDVVEIYIPQGNQDGYKNALGRKNFKKTIEYDPDAIGIERDESTEKHTVGF